MRSLRESVSWTQTKPSAPSVEQGWWRLLAACADYDPDLFFPIGSSRPASRQTERAKAVCAKCPVRLECLDWAQTTGQTHGVWGGLDEEQRAAQKEPLLDEDYPQSG